MKRLVIYLRQIFFEDIRASLLLAGLVVTIFCWTIGIFFWGLELWLLPLMLGILVLKVFGPVIFIGYLRIKNINDAPAASGLGRLKSAVLGVYIGFILLSPIDNWDKGQRQRSGLILSESLEAYKVREGHYPPDLLRIKNSVADLPVTYALNKFDYHLNGDNDYDLDIPVAIMDRWHWDKDKKVFVYSDF